MKKVIEDIQKFYKYAVYSAKAELKAEISNSYLSWLWWILDPMLFMMVYAFISIIVFSKGEKYFMAFVFIGLTFWDFFNKTVKQSVKIIQKNSQVVSKVYLPKYILILTKMGTNGFKMLISFVLIVCMMIMYKTPINMNILYVIPLLLTLCMLTFGVSTILMHFGVFVEDLANVINVLLRLAFYLSGIFYSIEGRVPSPYGELLLRLNPMALLISDMRNALIYASPIHQTEVFIWFLISGVLTAVGLRLIYKYENSYVKVM